jgi:hypothetical protein
VTRCYRVAQKILRVLIVTPRLTKNSVQGNIRHPDIISRILGILKSVLPGGSTITSDIVDYIALSEDDSDAIFKDSKILIQCDPQQSMSDNNQKNALVRIYVNGDALNDITWQPLPNQVPQPAKRDGLCTDVQQPPTPTTFSASSVSVQRSSAISSSLSSRDSAESTPSTPPTTTSQGIMTITPAPVSMSYGLVFGEDCIKETTVTTDPRVLYSYCVSYSVTYSSITFWPTTSSASPPAAGLASYHASLSA